MTNHVRQLRNAPSRRARTFSAPSRQRRSGMTLVLNTSLMPPLDRAQIVRQVIAETMVHVDIDFPGPKGDADAHGLIIDVGDLRLCSVRSNATRVHRTPALARDSQEPTIFLALQTPGSSLQLSQGGRTATLKPGQLAFCDSSSEYTLLDDLGIQQHFFAIKVASLALPYDLVRRLRAVPLAPGHPVADLAAAYFGRMAARREVATHPSANALGQPSIELVRALITTHLDSTALAQESLHSSLLLRVLEYARAHLHDPRLNAAEIAAEHHISVRHLYKVLAEGEVSLGDWIRTQRLEACRSDLRGAEWSHLTIASIARRHGFTDASTFGRLFRTAYGLSPREWREARTATTGNPVRG
ncbi:helix-turn-helix domain-containing protein [Pedococcus sp. KACC 23699]|uniref:Helix-turn-helix domain-containing protein n=1 Tax=Pedococcus sp. KACC 23699 TaxID=3149228 RepID=A0AAU7JVC0_9MICO